MCGKERGEEGALPPPGKVSAAYHTEPPSILTIATLTMAILTIATLTMATLTIATLTMAILTIATFTMATLTIATLTMAILTMTLRTMAYSFWLYFPRSGGCARATASGSSPSDRASSATPPSGRPCATSEQPPSASPAAAQPPCNRPAAAPQRRVRLVCNRLRRRGRRWGAAGAAGAPAEETPEGQRGSGPCCLVVGVTGSHLLFLICRGTCSASGTFVSPFYAGHPPQRFPGPATACCATAAASGWPVAARLRIVSSICTPSQQSAR